MCMIFLNFNFVVGFMSLFVSHLRALVQRMGVKNTSNTHTHTQIKRRLQRFHAAGKMQKLSERH